MALVTEAVGHASLVDGSLADTYHTHSGGGGSAPSVFYAQGADTANLGTAFGTVDWGTAIFADTGYTESAGVVTIGSALNGKRARIDFALTGTGAGSRVEVQLDLEVDPGGGYAAVAQANNYTARNSSTDTGGLNGYHYVTLTTGMLIRLRARRVGSTANKVILGTSISIETK